MTIVWPKIIKLADVVDALDALAEQVALNAQRITALEAKYDAVVLTRGQRIDVLEATVNEHEAGAVIREQEIDQLKASLARLRWATTTGRKP